uniref:hypothetical protein n=1 Tax=Sphingomonas bacterium TaxID=1895847 RepID=UPI0026122F7B|nr:hypothetical protein [Sphingomonas bacterium]
MRFGTRIFRVNIMHMVGPGFLVGGTKTENREIMFNAATMRRPRGTKSRCFAGVSAGQRTAGPRCFPDYPYKFSCRGVFFCGDFIKQLNISRLRAPPVQQNR